MRNAEEYNHDGCDIQIHYDEDPGNPRTEWDNQFTMVCFHSRYTLGDEDGKSQAQDDVRSSPLYTEWWEDCGNDDMLDLDDPQDLWTALERVGMITLPLYLYDHSGLTMSTAGFACRWDSGQVGFIYAHPASVRKEHSWKRISPQRRQQVVTWMMGEVKEYDRYLTGDVYGYTVTSPYGGEASCWGFFGLKYAKEEAESSADAMIADGKREEAEALAAYRLRKTMCLKGLIRHNVALAYRPRIMGMLR